MSIAQRLADRVPRYTSYPTAPHFHPGIDADVFAGWLAELPDGMPLSLYFHIPFCDTLCWFCGCHTRVVNTYSPVAGYLGLLHREIETTSRALRGRHPVIHLHFGGGSPTMLTPDDFTGLCERIRTSFAVTQGAEIAVEIDPRGLTRKMIDAMAKNGVNRASVGIQDFDPKVQQAINRIQPFELTRDVVERLRAAGIKRLNLDLVYGLPYQTVGLLEKTIRQAVTFAPDRLAIFGYAHVPHFKKHQELIDAAALPGVEERLRQFDAAHALLRHLGYVAVGLDHFAKPGDSMALAVEQGRLSRNFQGYTTDNAPALIGLGASAISALPQGYAQNASDVPAWRNAIRAGKGPTARGVALDEDDRLRRSIIERLMCDLAVDLDAVSGGQGVCFARELAALAPLAREGLIRIAGRRIQVLPHARAALRSVCAVFDRYLRQGEGRHALAV